MEQGKNENEQRQVARRHLVFYLRIFDGLGSRILGHLMDISHRGLMILSDEPIAVNEEYRLRMRLPQEVSGSDEIIFGAVSRWCRRDENPDFYIIGFQIQDMNNETRSLISDLIDEFGFAEHY